MTRIMKASALALFALTTLAPMAAAQRRRVIIVRRSPVFVYRDPFFDPWYPYGPYPYGYYNVPNTGEVKLETHMKDAQVFVDGGFAGMTGKLHHMNLNPGTHTIELRNNDGGVIFQESVNVIAGKTTKVEVG